MEYDDLLEDMKKSRKEKNLFSNVLTETMTNKEFADKAKTFIEAAENQKKIEREQEKAEEATRKALHDVIDAIDTRKKLAPGIKPAREKPSSAQTKKPGTTSLEDAENDPDFSPLKNGRVYPAIPNKTTDLLKNEVSYKGKKYTVDVEGILHRLYDKVQAADWPAEPKEQKRWWRLVYAYLKDRKIIKVLDKEKYAPFVNFVVAYCQPDINYKTLADNFGRNVKLPTKKKFDVNTQGYIDVPDTSSIEKLLDGCLKEAS